ncbi:MAG: M42 family metallopeptidase [Candidatus Delongbacteria bacterium]|nr:M42 family metallopeptidase [Candidatus Delongbacteria bacterium]MBN2836663.1 M42 family metallopeptidase [Candidatus Delongbacteria bacterium]
MKEAKNLAWNVLPDLLNIKSVAGNCSRAIEKVKELVKDYGYEIQETNKGGLIIKISGKDSSKSRVLSAHVDTLGGMVKSIGGNGRVYITPIGGVYPYSVEGEYVTVETVDGKMIRGTILHDDPSAHVNKDLDSDKRSFKNVSIRLDEVVKDSDDVEKLGISVGDYVFFDPRVEVSNSGFIKSRHLDDKAGVVVLLGAIDYFSRNKIVPPYDTYIYISVAEEVGNGLVSKIPTNCFEVVAVDMGALGGGQTSDEFTVSICAKDSSGPFDYTLRKKIVNLAKENNISYKVDIYPFYGSDAAAALRTGIDAKHMLFGPGIDASHSFERVHRDSINASTELAIKYIESL